MLSLSASGTKARIGPNIHPGNKKVLHWSRRSSQDSGGKTQRWAQIGFQMGRLLGQQSGSRCTTALPHTLAVIRGESVTRILTTPGLGAQNAALALSLTTAESFSFWLVLGIRSSVEVWGLLHTLVFQAWSWWKKASGFPGVLAP